MAAGGMRDVFKSALSLLRVARESRFDCRDLPSPQGDRSVCYVLGNGPSLYNDIHDKLDYFSRQYVICVNQFALSDWFSVLRPKYYVLVDPMWWLETAPPQTQEVRGRLFAAFRHNVDWEMTLFIPHEAHELYRRELGDARNVRLVRFNRTPFWGNRELVFRLYDIGLGMPQAQNVVVAAIFIAMKLRFQTIGILGADHSWHESLVLGEDNKVYVRYGYFNDRSPMLAPFTIDGSTGNIFTMEKIFLAIGRMFQSYMELADYANHRSVSVVNLSSVSYIDAFPRACVGNFIKRAGRVCSDDVCVV